MKKLVYLTLISLAMIQCSSDENNLYSIEGTWFYLKKNGETVDDCQQRSTIRFNSDNTYNATFWLLDGSCDVNDTANGDWRKVDDNSFTINSQNVTITLTDENTMKTESGSRTEIWKRG